MLVLNSSFVNVAQLNRRIHKNIYKHFTLCGVALFNGIPLL